ncbi:hypothetical protein B566_EDAN013185 [Ephemera danica]|nr:hypothetical protein B566_EDAN013185 [Ephemera danica]
MADLLSDGDSDDNSGFNINKSYAEKYDTWRGKEELQKFAGRYGEEALAKLDNSDDETSTSTEEDEDAKLYFHSMFQSEVTPQFEKQFFKTLSCLKKKDPKIYDANVKFFEKKVSSDAQDKAASQKKKKDKKMFLRDYERKMLLERGGQISSDEEQEEEQVCSPTFVQEQKAIKQSFRAALNNDSDEDDETEGIGGLLKPRQKTEEEKTREEEEYREWLKGRKKELSNEEDSKDLGYLKDYWNDPKLEQNEAFLRDYILNKRYLEDEDKEYIPTYDELVHDSDEGGLSGDERTVEEMEKFEHKYNFRYEEPDQEFVKRYPRTTQSSLRLQDDRRRKHREEVRQRKIQEKEAKRHELHQLKAIKRKEIAERLEKLKEITGNTDIQFMVL